MTINETKLRALIDELEKYLTSIHEASVAKLEDGPLGALQQVRVASVCALLRIKAATNAKEAALVRSCAAVKETNMTTTTTIDEVGVMTLQTELFSRLQKDVRKRNMLTRYEYAIHTDDARAFPRAFPDLESAMKAANDSIGYNNEIDTWHEEDMPCCSVNQWILRRENPEEEEGFETIAVIIPQKAKR